MGVSLELPIIGRDTIADGTVEVRFGRGDAAFDFKAGQYLRATIRHPIHEDEQDNRRDMSISSSPHEKGFLSIAFRVSESGFKKNIMELSLGTEATIEGPFGVFTLPEDASRPIVFIAGGIGITPFMSMLRFATEEQLLHPIILLYANTTRESTAYRAELLELEEKNKHFRMKEKIGLLDEQFVSEGAGDAFRDSSCQWYMAGPPGFVGAARKILLQHSVAEENLIVEEFKGYAASGAPEGGH